MANHVRNTTSENGTPFSIGVFAAFTLSRTLQTNDAVITLLIRLVSKIYRIQTTNKFRKAIFTKKKKCKPMNRVNEKKPIIYLFS